MSESVRRSRRSTSRARARSKSPAPPKKVASSGTTVIPTLVSTDQALIVNIVLHAFYAVTFFGFIDGFSLEGITGSFVAPEGYKGLCGGLNVWMGLMNVAFALSVINAYRNASEAQKKNLLLARSIQWSVWFMLVVFTGPSAAKGDGGFLGSEYIKSVIITFAAGIISRHGANGAKTNSAAMNISNNAGKAFALIIIANLLHTYNVGVSQGVDYLGTHGSAVCKTNNGFFASMVFLMTMDFVHAMNASGYYQKVALQVIGSMQLVFFVTSYLQRAGFPTEQMYQFNLVATGFIAAVAFWASNN